MSRQTELAKNTAILTFGKICTQFISFFLLPLYTAVLATEDYGTFDLMVTYATLFLPLVNWQFDQGIFRFMLEVRDSKKGQSKLFSTTLIASTIQAGIYVILLGTLTAVFNPANQFALVFGDFRFELSIQPLHGIFLILYVVLSVYTALLLQFIRGLGKNGVYAMASFISATSTVVFNVIALVILKMGVLGLFVSTLAAQLVTIIFMIAVIRPWTFFSPGLYDKKVFRMVKKYSVPLIPNNLAWWVVNASDRVIVSQVLDLSFNGLYTVANKFPGVFISFYNIFNLSWTETISLHFNDKDRDSFLSETITTMFKLFSGACLGIVAIMPFLFPVMVDQKYNDAYPQILILMYATLFRVIVGLYSCVYIATKETKKIAYTSIAAAVVNIAVHIALIGFIGLYAASVSTLVSFAAMAIIRYMDINRTIRMKIDRSILLSTTVIGIGLAVTYYLNNFWINLVMLALICVYAVAMNLSFIRSAFKTAGKLKNKLLKKK